MSFWNETREAKLRAQLESLPWVSFGYLFGSTARGEARADSDVDLAVALASGAPEDAFWQLLQRLDAADDRLHLLILDDAPPLLRQRVFRDGRLLFERNHNERLAFQVRSIREYCDLVPWYELHYQATRQRLLKGQAIHGGPSDLIAAARRAGRLFGEAASLSGGS
ncbi:nucleotidyltransferase domain-containing protein [bacterium CPR1]|nr:nucleotidyltransferase domain-containing protein [bacterium CPR1]